MRLQTQNYIHTLFACHFGVPFNAATVIRNYLQKDALKQDLYVDLVDSIVSQLPIPKLRYQNFWLLFENDADMVSYNDWRQNKNVDGKNVKYLSVGQNVLIERFSIYLQGLTNTYFLEIRKTFSGKLAYNKNYILDELVVSYSEKLDKHTFYLEVEHLMNILKTTSKIPFELFNVK